MATLEEYKSKYSNALSVITQKGVRLSHMHIQNNKFFLQGAAPSEQAKNDVWNAIKAVDPTYSDLTCDLTIDTSLPSPAEPQATTSGGPTSSRMYTVQPGDTLSKIAKDFYGNANEYNKIFQANQDKLDSADKIQVGQELLIP